ncbi:MAG: hypothetical protein H7067_17025, partial [Burkholderiales bacterium]|nr:hypothetical protein [Opitutaceae bacterium]
ADTCFAEAETDSRVLMRIAISHACSGPELHRETLICDHAEIEYVTNQQVTVRWRDGRVERRVLEPFDAQIVNLRELISCLRGTSAKPPSTLVDSRPFVHLHALAYLSAGKIESFAEAEIERADPAKPAGAQYLAVPGLAAAAELFLDKGKWPWKQPRVAVPAELGTLRSSVGDMLPAADPAMVAINPV